MEKINERFPKLKNDLFLRACKGEIVERVPVWIMRQAGRYLPEFKAVRADSNFFTVCQTPDLAATVTIQPIDRFPLDAAIIFSDILVIPQAMGLEVQMIPGKGPNFPDPVREISDLSRVQFPINVKEKLGYVFDALTLTRQRLDGRVPLIGFTGAPWTLFTYCIEGGGGDLTKAKIWLYKNPIESHRFLRMLTDVSVDYLLGQVEAGAQALQVFDSWSGELSPSLFDEFCLPYLIEIADRVKQVYPDIPMICFPKGSNFALKQLAEKSKYNVLGLDWTIDPKQAREYVSGHNVTLQGNMDPCILYAGDQIIKEQVEIMLKSFGTQKYIANLGHGMQPQMTPEMASSFVQHVHEISESLIKDNK